jgi:hypothetical protein
VRPWPAPPSPRRTVAAAVALLILGCVHPAGTTAHPLAPALLELDERGDGTIGVTWTTSVMTVRGTALEPALPPHCKALTGAAARIDRDRIIRSWTADCSPGGLVGQRIGVDGLVSGYTDVLLRVRHAHGGTTRAVLRASEPSVVLPERASAAEVGRDYLALGVAHILTGWDHLLFVFGLLLLVRGVAPLVKTITAFTLGHSLTLSLTVLGYTPVSSRPIEVAIAFSIFLLAVELSRGPRAREGVIRRFPWLVAASFGLLHGAGFAGALAEIGLPAHEIPLALLSFNVGIELGQLAFVAAVLATRWVGRGLLERLPRWSEWVPIYTLGCLSAYWCLARLAAWVAYAAAGH